MKSDSTVWAWGWNEHGQLGDGTDTDRNTPVQVLGESGFEYLDGIISISCGGYHTIAVKYDDSVWTWGSNGWGQLGINDNDDDVHSIPIQVHDEFDIDFFNVYE